mmetsp:Transcript_5826/g.6566  ORF Transcript_5826/g.6566 Transcript_5826/m.6566 type:complete len:179 (-) Transcript_5826:51-587(-)
MTDSDQLQVEKAKILAKEFARHNTDERGNTYAKLWESPEFRESFDYKMGYEKKNMLKYRLDTIFRHTKMSKQLFQKVYYYPNLLLEDEGTLRKQFVTENGSHDLRGTAVNWLLGVSFFPALWVASTRFRGWPCIFGVSISWYLLHKQIHEINTNMMQGNLNSFAAPLVEKYKITDHHD